MDRMDGPVELILINDGSRDRSLELLRELHEKTREFVTSVLPAISVIK